MYILKLTNKEGQCYLVDSMSTDKLTNLKTIPNELSGTDLNSLSMEVLKEIDDLTYNISLVKFNCAIDEINSSHKFNLINGRFRVDKYFFNKKQAYIVVLRCINNDKCYLFTSRNPVSRLYRMYNENLFIKSMREDIENYGIDSIEISIYGPFNDQNMSHETRRTFKMLGFSGEISELSTDIKHLYKKSIYLNVFALGRYKGFRPRRDYINEKAHNSSLIRD